MSAYSLYKVEDVVGTAEKDRFEVFNWQSSCKNLGYYWHDQNPRTS